mmetsp:Transcript_30371/g.78965  ORF Transcript_30371/g.78965 Transcript_30371/m.78965 type:complete len:208 (-) Transcript_30371:1479-2102(-)
MADTHPCCHRTQCRLGMAGTMPTPGSVGGVPARTAGRPAQPAMVGACWRGTARTRLWQLREWFLWDMPCMKWSPERVGDAPLDTAGSWCPPGLAGRCSRGTARTPSSRDQQRCRCGRASTRWTRASADYARVRTAGSHPGREATGTCGRGIARTAAGPRRVWRRRLLGWRQRGIHSPPSQAVYGRPGTSNCPPAAYQSSRRPAAAQR